MKNLQPFKRTNFFSGRLLTAEDLLREQEYNREKRRLHNRYLHGWGVVDGLNVSVEGLSIHVSSGLALDCEGNEIVVAQTFTLDVPKLDVDRTVMFVGIRYEEHKIEEVAGGDSNERQWSCIEESFEVLLQSENSNRGHRRVRRHWYSCGMQHPLSIARIKIGPGGWRIDRRYHPPAVK